MTTETLTGPESLDALDLAALLCSRVCHDVISPVGAINNGLEVLEDEADEQTRVFALDLIRKSARQASAKLQFARLAFGAAGSAGAQIDLRDAENVARGILEGDKVTLEWAGAAGPLPKNRVKLLLNLLLVAVSTIPRGGRVAVAVETEPRTAFTLTATGLNARVPQGLESVLAGQGSPQAIDAHSIQPYYARRLAEAAGMAVAIRSEGDRIVVAATQPA